MGYVSPAFDVSAPSSPQYLSSKLESHLKLDWYNEQAVKSEAHRQANQPVRNLYVVSGHRKVRSIGSAQDADRSCEGTEQLPVVL